MIVVVILAHGNSYNYTIYYMNLKLKNKVLINSINALVFDKTQ